MLSIRIGRKWNFLRVNFVSTRHRPTHLRTTEQVQMQMINSLASVISTIEHRSKAAAGNSELSGDVLRRQKKIFKHTRVLHSYVENVGDVFFRDDQNMNGCLGANILESKDALILKYLLSRQGPLDNLAEDTFFGFSFIVRSHSGKGL